MTTTKDEEERRFQAVLKQFATHGGEPVGSEAEEQASLERFLARTVALDTATGKYVFAVDATPTVGHSIREYRRDRQLTVGELAQRVGMTAEQIEKAEGLATPFTGKQDLVVKRLAAETGAGPLKAMRLIKELATGEAAASADAEEPMLLAARKAPKK